MKNKIKKLEGSSQTQTWAGFMTKKKSQCKEVRKDVALQTQFKNFSDRYTKDEDFKVMTTRRESNTKLATTITVDSLIHNLGNDPNNSRLVVTKVL